MAIQQTSRWRRSSYCSPSQCVEVSNTGEIRDSKNPTGRSLRMTPRFLANLKAGKFDR